MCQSWANGSAVLEEVADATRQSPPGPLPRCLPSFWAARPLPLQRASSTVAEEVWGGWWHCEWLWGRRGCGDGGAGREPSRAWRPLLEAPPSEVTAALTGRCASVISFTPPSVSGGRRHSVLVFGIKDSRLQELARCPAPQSRPGRLLCR